MTDEARGEVIAGALIACICGGGAVAVLAQVVGWGWLLVAGGVVLGVAGVVAIGVGVLAGIAQHYSRG